jgi:Bacterial Ig-like domain (group 2)
MFFRSARLQCFGTHLLPLSLLTLLTATLAAQQAKVLAPHQPVAPRVEKPLPWHTPAVLRSMVGGLWMIDANFKSSIYLKNDVETDPITVTPILHLSNGREYPLKEVKLDPAGIAVISINQALADKGIASWATLMGYVEIQYRWSWDALCVTVQNVDVPHSVIYAYGLRPASQPNAQAQGQMEATVPPHVLEGMWWKQEPNVTGFVALSNVSAQAISASVQLTDNQSIPVTEQTITVSPHCTKLIRLSELQQSAALEGGIRITYGGSEDDLIANGGLEDIATGYSAALPLRLAATMQEDLPASSYAALGLMTGAADPMMSFPEGTSFSPYSVMRNVSAKPISVIPTLWWMEGAGPHSARPGLVQLAPYQTQSLNLPALLSAAGLKNFNGSFNLVLDVQGGPIQALLVASGSVDKKNTYVFEVGSTGLQESQARSLSYWSIGNGDDTMVTLWNPADEAQDFVFTLFFTGGHYNFPIHLGPRATYMFNVSEIIHNQIPDAEGNIVPATIHEGSARLSGPKGVNQHILVAMGAGTYNVVKATCILMCSNCAGPSDFFIIDDPFSLAVSGTHQLQMYSQYVNGSQYNITGSSSWSSSATTVATVSVGLVSGVSAGSLTVTAKGPNEIANGKYCAPYVAPACPRLPPEASTPGTVQVPTSLKVISSPTISLSAIPGCTGGDSNYGIVLAITYLVLDQNSLPLTSSQMEPQEEIINEFVNGFPGIPPSPKPNWTDIGPTQYPGTSQFTNAGVFLDAPYGTCAFGAFVETYTQPISILLNGNRYTVRTNNWTTTSSVAAHGSISNGVDISKSR